MPYKDTVLQAQYQVSWYQKNKQKVKEQHAQYRKQNKPRLIAWLEEYKRTLCCEQCPENHPACLQFHHRDPSTKRFTISTAVRYCVCVEELLIEIAKCSVLCANCHAKHHAASVTLPTLGT